MTEKDKPQNLWKVLKNLGCLSKAKSTPSSCITLSIDGKEVNKKEDIANHFNTHFTSVAHKLVEKLPSSPSLYRPEHIQDFYAKIGVIGDMLKGFNSAKATGLDNISASLLKDAADLIAPFFDDIINLSLKQGTVLDDIKHSKVIHIFQER